MAGIFTLILALVFVGQAAAHPEPDLPVRSHFSEGGESKITLELDPRAFLDDPEAEDYWDKAKVDELGEEGLKDLKAKADVFVSERLRFHFIPMGELKPAFEWKFGKLPNPPEMVENDDAWILFGTWDLTVPNGITSYKLEALDMTGEKMGIPLNVRFLNYIDDEQVERYAVLFPGETSFALDLTGLTAVAPSKPDEGAVGVKADTGDLFGIFVDEVKHGYSHVVPTATFPDGWDHVLFVLGLFLMSRSLGPLLFQVTAFTLAHTVTLWLGAVYEWNPPGSIVEPIIAASIAFVALENIFVGRYTHWRLLIVFVFGLIHGLAFAGELRPEISSQTAFIVGLLGVNLGVELAQIVFIIGALVLTCWIRDKENYRNFVVIPGSIIIALAGIYWFLERTVL